MYDQTDGIPNKVIDVLAPLRKRHDFLALENPESLLYDLRAGGHEDAAAYLTTETGVFDREKFEAAVIAIMKKLRAGRIS